MDTQETLLRLGLSLAIGLMVGLERHWRERDAMPGQRTAGLRTFGLSGLLGGVTATIATSFPAGSEVASALVLAATFGGYSAALIVFKRAEAMEDDTFSVTTVVAGLLVFALGAVAVLGDKTVAAAAGVTATALLASREVLHGLLQRMTWPELRSAIIILVMTFVALPLAPRAPIGPFGGVDLAEVWTLAILMAIISYAGYVAIRLLGARRGLLLAGAVGGLASSTAVAMTFARRSKTMEAPPRALAAGAASAAAVSVLRIGGLALALSPPLLPLLGPPLILAALGFAGMALVYALGAAEDGRAQEPATVANPFDLVVILRFTLIIAAASFLVRAGVALLGQASLIPLAFVGGLGDADAVVLSVTRLPASVSPLAITATAIAASMAGDILAKTAFAQVLGSRAYGLYYAGASVSALALGTLGFFGAQVLLGP